MANYYMDNNGRIHDRDLEGHHRPAPTQPRGTPTRPRAAPAQPAPVKAGAPRILAFVIFMLFFSGLAADLVYRYLVAGLLYDFVEEPSGWRQELINWSYVHTQGLMKPITTVLSMLFGTALSASENHNLKGWAEAAVCSVIVAVLVGLVLAWVADIAAIVRYGGIALLVITPFL